MTSPKVKRIEMAKRSSALPNELRVDVAIIGGGVGGVAAALSALDAGATVVITEPTRWLGGQLTSQLTPLDDHPAIESDGANRSYRMFRSALREFYRRNFPLVRAARDDPYLNPGAGWVSPVCVDPRVAVAVIDQMLLPYVSSGRLRVLLGASPVSAEVEGDRIRSVAVETETGSSCSITAPFFLDATELGDLLPLAGVEYVTGSEAQSDTGEPGAPSEAEPKNMQGVTWCFAVEHLEGEDHRIERPESYDYWSTHCPDQLGGDQPIFGLEPRKKMNGTTGQAFSFEPNPDDDPFAVNLNHYDHSRLPLSPLWLFRRIAARKLFDDGFYRSDITVINWPMNDYYGGPLFDVDDAADHWAGAKDLSRNLLYWLQTDAPRLDGGTGWAGLRLHSEVAGTSDGFAMHPYIRESRRIQAQTTIVEQDVSTRYRTDRGAKQYVDTVGVGHYFWIDQHHTTGSPRGSAGTPHPFEIPLGALLPIRVRNLIPACKNIGTTQITNGCYRLHPVEWSVGEAAGALAAFCLAENTSPHGVAASDQLLGDYQRMLDKQGVQLRWPAGSRGQPV